MAIANLKLDKLKLNNFFDEQKAAKLYSEPTHALIHTYTAVADPGGGGGAGPEVNSVTISFNYFFSFLMRRPTLCHKFCKSLPPPTHWTNFWIHYCIHTYTHIHTHLHHNMTFTYKAPGVTSPDLAELSYCILHYCAYD